MNINSCNLMKCLCGYQDKTLKNSVYIGSSVTVKEINYCKMFKVCMLWVHWRSKGGWGPRAALCWLKFNFFNKLKKSSSFSLLFLNKFFKVLKFLTLQLLCLEALDWQASPKHTTSGCWVCKLMKWLLKSLGQIQCAKMPQRLSWHQDFFNTLTWGAIVPQSLHLPRQTKLSQLKVIWTRKEMTFDDRSANISAPVVCGLYVLPSSQNLIKKALHEITVNSQG